MRHIGKKQLNSLMTFLNDGPKGGTAKEGLGGRAEGALRGVRARREADEAGQYIGMLKHDIFSWLSG
jgi:hypothetical protein